MKEEIRIHLSNPKQLEKMYRDNKLPFKRAFSSLYPELKGNAFADFWNERLNYENDDLSWGSHKELAFVIISSIIAGLIAKSPVFFSIDDEFFYSRNIGFIVFPALSAYFAWKNKLSIGKIAFIAGATLFGLIFINSFPDVKKIDTLTLSCTHLLLCLWAILSFSFISEKRNDQAKQLAYLQYNRDLIVMTSLILISGAIMTGLTVGLFDLIGIKIQEFFFENVVVFGLATVPIFGTYLTKTNPQLVGKVSTVIAKIFSPLVLMMLITYLGAIIFSSKNPYNDREFLLLFNALLMGVMAIIFFSVAENSKTKKSKAEVWVLFLLSAVTIIVNGIALSAILFRIAEWGITPNRAAVLGSNVLILVNLLLVTVQLFRVVAKKADLSGVKQAMAVYLPVYCLWAAIVTFLFPFIFGFK